MSLGTRGRRRRMLNEEVRGALADSRDASGEIQQVSSTPPNEGSRYTDAASIENHPQITDFVPRRFRSYAILILMGAGIIAVLVVFRLRALELASFLGGGIGQAFVDKIAEGLVAWFSSVALLVASVVAWLVYSLRRHRINDYRARYRVWIGLAGVTLFMSINMTAGLHIPWCRAMRLVTGWTAFPSDAVWWIAPAAILFGWIGIRILPDLAESRIAILAYLATAACYAITVVHHTGWFPFELGLLASQSVVAATLLGHLFLLLTVTSYARYVVLDVQGLIEHPPQVIPADSKRQSRRMENGNGSKLRKTSVNRLKQSKPATATRRTDLSDQPAGAASKRRQTHRRQGNASDLSEWVDGSEPETDEYHDDQPSRPRRLSKAERKRLRKLKAEARQRAA